MPCAFAATPPDSRTDDWDGMIVAPLLRNRGRVRHREGATPHDARGHICTIEGSMEAETALWPKL